MTPNKGAKLTVKEDCFCEGYLHEVLLYYREGIKEKKLKENDIVIFKEKFINMYGIYWRVEKDGEIYDIPPHKLLPYTIDEIISKRPRHQNKPNWNR